MNRFKTIGMTLALLAGVSHLGVSQTSKGILAGTVRDKTGAVLVGAKVTVTSEDTGETRTIPTTPQGGYRVEAINPGLYEIQVAAAGFSPVDVKDIRVQPSLVTTYDLVLALGAVANTVTVEANSNAINTENGQLAGTVDLKELADVPIPSLNPFELVATLPGVQLVNPALNVEGSGGNYEQLIVNGARPRSNNYMLDSQDINDVGIGGQSFNPVVPDMYQTVTALENSSSAEYGRSGGAVINLVTKNGTNQFHGTAFELYSGSGLNALDGVTREGKPFPPGSPSPKARYDQHQFGFTAGGPLWKNKLFAFGGTQFTRFYGTSPSGSINLPDAAGYAELTAIAATSATAGTQVALLQGLLNEGSYLTSYQNLNIASTSLSVLGTNCPGGNSTTVCKVTIGTFQRPPVSQQEPDTQWMYRIDFIPVSSDTFTFRYLHDRESFTPDLGLNTSGLPGFDGQVGGPTELGQGTWTHDFSPNLLNEFRVSEVRLNSQFAPTPQTLANPLAKNYNVTLSGSNLPELGISQNIPQGRLQELYQFQDTVSWIKGRQSLRAGADVGRDHETDLIAQNALGQLTFAGGAAASLNNFINNQLGTGGNLTKSFGPTRVDPHLWKLAFFGQDDIKLTPELTVNLGIRYDYDTNPENALAYPSVNESKPYAPISTVIPVQADKNNIAPRVGFAFNPREGIFADGKTVFHGGFGVYYDVDFTNILINSAQSSPNAPTTLETSTATAPITNPAVALAAATATLSGTSSVQSVASSLVNPLTYQYNLGLEREIPAQIKVTINYVGARGEKLFANHQLNPYYNGARLNTSRSAINVRDNGAVSNYNALQVEVSRRFTHGLSFRAAYTYGKDLDDASEVFALFSNPNTSYQANLQRLAQDYGNSAWDRRHVASFEYVYQPAGFHSNSAIADGLLEAFTRHFILSGTTQFATGPYTDVQIDGVDTNNDLNPYNDRPIIGNPNAPFASAGIDGAILVNDFGIPATPGVYYDMAKLNDPNTDVVPVTPSQERFLIPYGVQYTTKEVGRDSFENPGQSFWNMALEKDIPAKFTHLENGQFVMRVECQNVGNHNNVSVLDTNLLDVGGPFLNKSLAREATYQNFRLWAKFTF